MFNRQMHDPAPRNREAHERLCSFLGLEADASFETIIATIRTNYILEERKGIVEGSTGRLPYTLTHYRDGFGQDIVRAQAPGASSSIDFITPTHLIDSVERSVIRDLKSQIEGTLRLYHGGLLSDLAVLLEQKARQ